MSPLNEHKDMIAITAYYRREAELKAQVADLQRQLDNARTDWLCGECDGRGCEAENQNSILLAELDEQARLNGKGSEREAALLAKMERLERENARLIPIVEAAKAYVDYDIEGESTLWPEANEKFEALKAAVEARKDQP